MTEKWDAIRLPSYEKNGFTPEVASDFEGVAIWTPDSVSLKASASRIPAFGLVRLGDQSMRDLAIDDRHPLRAVVVGAIFANVNAPFVGNVVLQAPLFPVAPGGAATEYFSVNLAECLRLPAGGGKLFVFASVGPHLAEARTLDVTQ